MDEFNPYAAPKADVITQDTEAETIRRKHINHEASIKAVGSLYGLAAIVLLVLLIVRLTGIGRASPYELGFLVGFALLALLTGMLARGLRNLRRWAAILVGIWAGIAMVLGFANLPNSAFGMVISAYILWLMVGPKGLFVTSAEYRAIIAQTPHVKRRTSVVVWVLLILLLVILGIGIFSAMNA